MADLISKLADLGISVPDTCFKNNVCLLKERVISFEVDDKHPTCKPLNNINKSQKSNEAKIFIILCTEAYVKTKNKPLLINVMTEKNEEFYNTIPFTSTAGSTTYHNDVIMNNTNNQDTRIWCKPFKSENDKEVLESINPSIPANMTVDEYINSEVTYKATQEGVVPLTSNFGKYLKYKESQLDKNKCKLDTQYKEAPRYIIEKEYCSQLTQDFSVLLTPNHMSFNNIKNFKISTSIPNSLGTTTVDTKEDKDKFYASFRIHIFYT